MNLNTGRKQKAGDIQRKVPVTVRAIIQRINRAIAKRDGCVHGLEWPHECDALAHGCAPLRVLKKARGSIRRTDVGEFYILNVLKNWIDETDVDLAKLARELGVLRPWEEVEEAEA
jgi:hypothetical protein